MVIGFIVVYYPVVVVRCGMRCDPGVVGVVSMEFSVSLSCVWLRCAVDIHYLIFKKKNDVYRICETEKYLATTIKYCMYLARSRSSTCKQYAVEFRIE